MQSISSRFWTRVVVSISYDDNHYTTGTSKEKMALFQFEFKDMKKKGLYGPFLLKDTFKVINIATSVSL